MLTRNGTVQDLRGVILFQLYISTYNVPEKSSRVDCDDGGFPHVLMSYMLVIDKHVMIHSHIDCEIQESL